MTAVEEDISHLKLPIEKQCVHKSWKVRKIGYEEAVKLFVQLDKKAPEWNKFTEILKKFVIDSNVAAQEKGLEATLVFIENSTIAGSVAEDIITGLVTKCYGSPKAKIKDIAIQITLMLIEIEKQDVVIEELVKGMDHKFPKIVLTCIRVATQGINEFGSKVLNTKLLLKKLQSILEDKDKSIRDEAKLLAIEIYSWIGPTPVKANLANLKPVQIQELEVEFEKVSGNKPQPTRFLRSEQVLTSEKLKTFNEDVVLEKSTDETSDSKEDIDPINILSLLSKDFYEKLEAKQWKERKEAIEMLECILIKATKLEDGEYGELVRSLKKRITNDKNVVIVGIAAKCLTLLAKGLKKRFDTYASACIPELLEKFKEKKHSVVLPLRDAVDAIYLSMTLESIQEDILFALNNKNPSVKAETVAFLARCFTKCTSTILNKKMLKIFTTVLVKTLNESDPIVRDNSAEALGTAWKVVTEKNILPFLTDVDPIKLVKIKEAAAKVVITAKLFSSVKDPASILSHDADKKETMNNKYTAKKNHAISNDLCKTITNNKAKKLKSARGGCQSIPSTAAIPLNETNKEIDDEELEKLALTFCSQEILNGIVNSSWKIRLSYVQEFSQIIDQIELPTVSSQVFIQLLNKKPGIKDSNVQVQKLRLECLKKVIEKFPITRFNMNYCVHDITSLLGDSKNGKLAGEVLSALAESIRLDLVCHEVLEYAFNVQKNPKVQTDALNWLSGAILEFGFIIEPKSVIQHAKKAVSASNPQVRMAVISLLGVLYLYMGPQLKLFFENEKSNIVQQINEEFEKHQKETPPKPTRGKKKKISTENLEVENNDEHLDYKVNIQDIVPRVDITPQITDDLINAFSDKDWKVRSNALTKLQNIISEAKFITNELGEIREVLNFRISDSNARLSSNTINLVEMISVAMGSSFKNYIKDYLPGVLSALGDPKTFKCQSARQCINTWADVCGYREFFGGNILYAALKNTSITLRSELWTWLAEKLPIIPSKIIPAEELKCLLPLLYVSLEDKNASIRNASERAVIGFMQHLGYASMYSACEKLKPMSIMICRAKLDKERPNLPTISIEKPKIVKPVPLVKSKGSKMPSSNKIITNVNKKENVIPLASVAIGKNKEVDSRSLLLHNNLKHQRDIDEHKLKSLKWNFTTPREEFVDQLREQMYTAGINKELITNMFHTNFKYHLVAIVTLSKDLNISDGNNLALISNLDLILKWITLRFFDTNPSVLIKGLEYLQKIFDVLTVNKYILHDTEASSFVPYLVKKLGDPKDTVKTQVRAILTQIAFIYPTTKLFQYIMDGLKSKNSRQRSECLEHLTFMIKDYGTSICQPSIPIAFKEIAKSIGDRDKSVRTAALNCFVTAFFLHGDALFKLIGNISEKDMDLLRERIKRASKNRVVPIANFQPTTKLILPSIELVPEEEEVVNDEYNSDSDENNDLLNVSQESNHEQSPLHSPPESENNMSNKTEDILIEHSSLLDAGFSEVIIKPQMTRFALDEKFIQELDAEVIKKPQLILKPYHWNTDNDEINFGKITQQKSQFILDKMPLSRPCLNMNSCSNTTFIKHPENISTSFEYIQLLINQISLQNIETSETAIENLNETLLRPNMRLMLLENDKILLVFYAIIKQLEILSESNNDISFRYKAIFNLCLNVCNCREFMLKLDETIFCDLLFKLLYLLSIKELVNSSDIQHFDRCINNVIINILERSDHTLVLCSLLIMLYDMVKCPQDSTALFKELLMKCIWKIVKDFQKWDDGIRYDLVLAQIHKFLEKFGSNQRKNQSTDIPLRTCKTVLHTMVKIHKDKVLKSLANSKFPKDSVMVVYIHRVIKYFNSKRRSKSCY